MSRIYNPRDILLRPVVSEKSYGLLDEGKYTFIVAPDANKVQIRQAVEEVFRVTVQSLTVHAVDSDKNLLLIKGAVPGPRGGLVMVRSAAREGTR